MTNDNKEPINKSNLANPNFVAEMLQEYQSWRRGEGKYAWAEDPTKYNTDPFTSKDLGLVIDSAIAFLKKQGAKKGNGTKHG